MSTNPAECLSFSDDVFALEAAYSAGEACLDQVLELVPTGTIEDAIGRLHQAVATL